MESRSPPRRPTNILGRRPSTAQASLAKILTIITTFPPHPPPSVVDLDLRLGFSSEITESGEESTVNKATDSSSAGECSGEADPQGGIGYIDLLLEAARQVSGESSPPPTRSPPPPPSSSKRRKVAIYGCDRQMEPIVRSRRGRSLTLPLRYRDSVLDSPVLRR